jgi:peptidoglycan/LPS O-acetylase OafA/YrhL
MHATVFFVEPIAPHPKAALVTTIPDVERTSFTAPSAPPVRKVGASAPVDRPHKPSTRHLPALDGVRAIAILMVIACHSAIGPAGITWAQSAIQRVAGLGWAGVDLFFVLSGFLITGILMDARESPHALRNFYARRVLRIVPVYITFLLFSIWIAPVVGSSNAAESALLHRTQIWYWTYSQNILIALHDWSASAYPTQHLWSLAVEEQFYLIWPLAVLFMTPANLWRTAVAGIVAAEVCRIAFLFHSSYGPANYVMLPMRMDTLAAGAFLACIYRDPSCWERMLEARKALTLVALVLLMVNLLFRHTIDNQAALEQAIVYPALVAIGAVIVASAAAGSAWMSNGALRFVARISYGMYVWHLVVRRLILAHVSLPDASSPHGWWLYYGVVALGTLGGTMVLALVSWYAIEQPILRLKRFVPNG